MAFATQSTKPSTFLPVFKATVATALSIDPTFVRIVAVPDPKAWAYMTGTLGAAVYLNQSVDLPAAGAGRNGTPVSQVVEVTFRTRGFMNQAGGNETLAQAHYDNELNIINAIHLIHLTADTVTPLFIMPPRLLPDGEGLKRITNPDGCIETSLLFRVDYPLRITTVQ